MVHHAVVCWDFFQTPVPRSERQSPGDVVTPPATESAQAFTTPPACRSQSMAPSAPYQTMHPVRPHTHTLTLNRYNIALTETALKMFQSFLFYQLWFGFPLGFM